MPELLQQRDNFFPQHILKPLTSLIINDVARKIVYNLDELKHPEIVREAVEFSRDQIQVPYNHAILKKYMINESKPSAAYERHKDPKRVSNAPLFLCTLDWEAHFDIWTEDWVQHRFETKANRLMIVDEWLDHRVSPPTNSSGIRSLLFLGIRK